jgi:hypothetical protein
MDLIQALFFTRKSESESDHYKLKLSNMKTLLYLSTAVTISLISTTSFAENDDLTNNNTEFTINIIDIQQPSCNGSNNGSATVEAVGGQEPYEYNWNTFPNQSSPQARNLTSGVYFVQVKDALGNVIFKSIEVDDPNKSHLSSVGEDIDELDLTSSVSGMNAPYSYKLNGDQIDEMKSQDLNDLPIGIHQLVITDASNCEMTQYIQIFEIDDNGNKIEESNPSKEKLISKNERSIRASNLIPTKTKEAHFNANIVLLENK